MDGSVPGAVDALAQAFLVELREAPADFGAWEAASLALARRSTADAMGRALELWDKELSLLRPRGSRTHSARRRTLATPTGDVSFRRRVLLDVDGLTSYPLDEALDLPRGDRVSPGARSLLVRAGAEVSFARAADLLRLSGGSTVSPTTAMRAVHSAGREIASREREAARALYEDGVPPESESLPAPDLRVEADGTYVRMRDGSTAEVKAMVAYAGKERAGARGRRVAPVRLGCVGEPPAAFWREAVAQLASRFDLSSVEVCRLGTDGEAQYLAGASALPFPSVESRLDPAHLDRAVGGCFPGRPSLAHAAVERLWAGGAGACAGLLEEAEADGSAREGAGRVAAYLRRHEGLIGRGPSMGTMEAEQQHMYKSRMGSVPMAWSREGADAMARLRSWLASGREAPRRTRAGSLSEARLGAREERLSRSPRMRRARSLESEGRGWEYPARGSVEGLRADVRHAACWYADGELG